MNAEYNRMVIDLYKNALAATKAKVKFNRTLVQDVENKLNYAIDESIIDGVAHDELDALKNDIGYLKFQLIE